MATVAYICTNTSEPLLQLETYCEEKSTGQLQSCQFLSGHEWGNKKVPHWLEN